MRLAAFSIAVFPVPFLPSSRRQLAPSTQSSFSATSQPYFCLASTNMSSASGDLPINKEHSDEAPVKCVPCSSLDKTAVLSPAHIKEQLSKTLPMWKLQESPAGIFSISRTFTAKNFQAALDSINNMGSIAEREGHHPDFHLTSYRNIEVILFTHKLGGVTENDLLLAKMLDEEVNVVYSPKWLKEHPEANKLNVE